MYNIYIYGHRDRLWRALFAFDPYRKFNMADSRSANMTTGGDNRSSWPHIRGPDPCPKESSNSRYPDTQLEK